MRGVNPVPDYLETVAGILEHDRDFTDREPVYSLDPEGSLFWIDRPASHLPIESVVAEPPLRGRSIKWPVRYARYRVNRSLATRANPFIGEVNAFGELALETLRQMASAHRRLEDHVRRLAQRSNSQYRHLAARIDELEAAVADLRGRLEAESPAGGGGAE